jgi:hypothetical protein
MKLKPAQSSHFFQKPCVAPATGMREYSAPSVTVWQQFDVHQVNTSNFASNGWQPARNSKMMAELFAK